MTWFLEIVCTATVTACLFNPDPNPPVPRYYATERQCNDAAVVVATQWRPGDAAWRFNCLAVKR